MCSEPTRVHLIQQASHRAGFSYAMTIKFSKITRRIGHFIGVRRRGAIRPKGQYYSNRRL
jgi:hypothetical protein